MAFLLSFFVKIKNEWSIPLAYEYILLREFCLNDVDF